MLHFPHFPIPALWHHTAATRWAAFRTAIAPQIEAVTPPDPFADFYDYHEHKVKPWNRKDSRAHHNAHYRRKAKP